MSKVSVLSIDAWADGEDGCWSWNDWTKIGECELDSLGETDADKIQWFVDNGFANARAKELGSIEDDGYNFTLKETDSNRPILAIAYGESEG